MAEEKKDEKSGITYGRRQIFSDYVEVTGDNIKQILLESFAEHMMNVNEIAYLRRYEKGDQPILNRKKVVRPDINNRIIENNAHVAVRFTVGYRYGQPISYVQRSKKDLDSYSKNTISNNTSDEIGVGLLNEMMFEQKKSSKDMKLANDFSIGGTGFRMILPNRNYHGNEGEESSPFEILVPNPMTTYVVYTNNVYRESLLGVSYTELKNGGIRFGAYSKTHYFEVLQSVEEEKNTFSGKKKKTKFDILSIEPHAIGEIPIIEYINDYERMGCFERAIPIMDALNIATSDRLNSIAQHVQSLLWLHNADLQKDDKDQIIQSGGIIVTKNNDHMQANIKYLESTLDQSAIQSMVDYLYEQYLQITGIPGREKSTGGNTGTAIMLSNGWQMAENYANTADLIFDESEKQCLKVVLKICRNFKDVPDEVKNLKLSDIEIHHGRKKDYELVQKASALATLINTGVDGNTAFTTVNLFPDSQQAWNDSKEGVEGIQRKLIAEIKQSTEQLKNVSDANVGDKSTPATDAELEIGYSDQTAEALVESIISVLKPLKENIDNTLAGEENE